MISGSRVLFGFFFSHIVLKTLLFASTTIQLESPKLNYPNYHASWAQWKMLVEPNGSSNGPLPMEEKVN